MLLAQQVSIISSTNVLIRSNYSAVPGPVRGSEASLQALSLVPSLIWGLQEVQELRVVPVFLYRYSMKMSLKKARSPGTTEGGRSD